MSINSENIQMSLRVSRDLYLQFRDKAFKKQYKHNPIIVRLMEMYVEGKIEVTLTRKRMTS